MELPQFDKQSLIDLAHAKMPFGKYEGRYLSDLPGPYVVWFKQKGFPQGKLGRQLQSVYELKVNGIEGLLREIRAKHPFRRT